MVAKCKTPMTDEERRLGEYALVQYHAAVYKVISMFNRKGRIPPDLDTDDLAQELRMQLYRKFHRYDANYRTASGQSVKPITFVMAILQRKVETVLVEHNRRGFRGLPAITTDAGKVVDGVADSLTEFQDEMVMTEEVEPKLTSQSQWSNGQWKRVMERIPNQKWRECVELVYRFGFSLGDVGVLMGLVGRERVRQMVNAGVICLSARTHLYDEDDFPADTKYPVTEQLERSSCLPGAGDKPASAVKHKDLFSDMRCIVMAKANKQGKDKTVGGLHSAAVKLGHAGGEKGGPARAAALSANRRTQIAKMGGEARAKKGK